MQVACPKCERMLDYSGDRPRFCAYCGQSLGDSSDAGMLATASFDSGSPLPMRIDATTFGTAAEHATRDPEQVAGYRIIRLLGRGGMGSVYEAEDGELGRRVALKLIAADHLSSSEAVERFRQEGRLASTLAHPRCVFVLAADEFRGRPYLVMELMPGETLQTLVEANGPLSVGVAVAKALDVIDGLREAHHQGIIHRDVKPSNCFLEADGRVKVGDFGLSKSLDGDANLTRTGSFVGTPLYASPEQIKRNPVDERTDLYSVAATLYFLLTGKPPHQANDASAVLAKIVSEPPTPLRTHRPELPAALESAILRGLERDRDRRWHDLGRFRDALLPFVPGELGLSDLALRAGAYCGDVLALFAIESLLLAPFLASLGVAAEAPGGVGLVFRRIGVATPWLIAAQRLLFLGYFTLFEGVWGASPAKRLAGLRVSLVEDGGPPGVKAAALRTLGFYALTALPGDVVTAFLFGFLPTRQAMLYQPLALAVQSAGYLALASTMKSAGGFRGLHERVSGTRVVRRGRRPRRRVSTGRRLPTRPDYAREMAGAPVGVLKSVGSFKVRGAVRWDGDRKVLLGEDSTLERPVWLVLRPKGSPAPPSTRRDLARPSRPRWLAGGEQAEGRWDAYAAPSGCPLGDLAGSSGLPWADVRPILQDLADELNRAAADGTLPPSLAVDQVWVQTDGSVLLADPLGAPPVAGLEAPAQARSLDLIKKAAALALEGGRRRPGWSAPGSGSGSIRAAVPVHAARMLDRLIGLPRQGDRPYNDPAELIADLEADRDKPTEVDRVRRLVHLAPACGALGQPLLLVFLLSFPGPLDAPPPFRRLIAATSLDNNPKTAVLAVAVVVLVGIVWAAFTQGGLLLGLAGISLVRADSRPAERWRCAWRAFIAWSPLAVLLIGSCWARARDIPYAPEALWALALALAVSYPFLALRRPSRSVHDALAGTYLVPE